MTTGQYGLTQQQEVGDEEEEEKNGYKCPQIYIEELADQLVTLFTATNRNPLKNRLSTQPDVIFHAKIFADYEIIDNNNNYYYSYTTY